MRLSFARPLCNAPFYKPLHPPEPSALSPSSPAFGEGKGESLYRIHGVYSNAVPGAVALVSSQSAPECTLQSLSYNTDTASSILLTLDCSDNICGCHLLHSLCNHPFYKPLHPPSPSALPPSSPTFGEGKGGVVPCTRGILEFCSRGSCTCVFAKCTRMYDTIPLLQYGYCKQYPPNARMLGQRMRLSFASFTLQRPLLQTSPSPCHFVTSPFLSILWKRKGDQSNDIHGSWML